VRWVCPAILSALAILFCPAAQADPVSAELVANTTAIQPGQPFTVGLHLHVAKGMHVYWINPGAGGGPIQIKWNLPDGFTAGPLQFPVPNEIPQPATGVIYGYENEVLLQTTITPPANLNQSGSVELKATGHWVVCSDVQCYFGKANLNLELPVGVGKPDHGDLFTAWQTRMPRNTADAFSKVDAVWNADTGKALLKFRWKDPAAAPANLSWLPGPSEELNVKAEGITKITNSGDTSVVLLSIQPVTGIEQKQTTISGVLSYHEDNQPPQGVAVTLDRKTLQLVDTDSN